MFISTSSQCIVVCGQFCVRHRHRRVSYQNYTARSFTVQVSTFTFRQRLALLNRSWRPAFHVSSYNLSSACYIFLCSVTKSDNRRQSNLNLSWRCLYLLCQIVEMNEWINCQEFSFSKSLSSVPREPEFWGYYSSYGQILNYCNIM